MKIEDKMTNNWVVEAKEWLEVISVAEMENAFRLLRNYGDSHIITAACESVGNLADNMRILVDTQSIESFDKLVDWILADMAIGYSGGSMPPDPEWLLEQGLIHNYSGDGISYLRDIVAGNGYKYL